MTTVDGRTPTLSHRQTAERDLISAVASLPGDLSDAEKSLVAWVLYAADASTIDALTGLIVKAAGK